MLTPDILFDSYRDITPAFLQSQGVTLPADGSGLYTGAQGGPPPGRGAAAVDQRLEGRRDHRDDRVEQPLRRSRDRVLRRSGHRLSGPCRKASPKGLRAAMERTGTDPAHTAMLGDKLLTDMLAAHRAGVRAWMVEPLGGTVGIWNRVLHLPAAPV